MRKEYDELTASNDEMVRLNIANTHRPVLSSCVRLKAWMWKSFASRICFPGLLTHPALNRKMNHACYLSSFHRTCGASHAALKETFGQVEHRLRRGNQCLKRLEASLKEVGLIESAIEDVKTDIEREGAQSLKDAENCLVKPGQAG